MDGRPNRRNKAAFSLRIIVDGRSNCRNKAGFSNSSGFRDVLLWKVGLTVEIKLCFQISPIFVTYYFGQ